MTQPTTSNWLISTKHSDLSAIKKIVGTFNGVAIKKELAAINVLVVDAMPTEMKAALLKAGAIVEPEINNTTF